MNVLALEFSSQCRSAAIARADGGEGVQVLAEATERTPRSRGPLHLIEAVLRDANLEREAVTRLAVGLGPGSYTGIRSALAVAQGWHLALPIDMVGISSVGSLAAQAQADGITGRVNILVDAQRGDAYHAAYEVRASSVDETVPLRLVLAHELDAVLRRPGIWIGPEVRRWVASGRLMAPSASVLARLSTRALPIGPPAKLEPIYLRETAFVKAPPRRLVD